MLPVAILMFNWVARETNKIALPAAVWASLAYTEQRAKKVVSDKLGLVDFAIGLVIFVLARRASAVFWGNSSYRRIVINPANQKGFWAS